MRLTDLERAERKTAGNDLQAQITDLATLYGWSWVHWRPLLTKRGWRVPVEGPLGAGWPDLTLARERDRRLIFAEVKRELEQIRPDQVAVLGMLRALACDDQATAVHQAGFEPSIEVYVWRPSDLRDPIEDSTIGRILR